MKSCKSAWTFNASSGAAHGLRNTPARSADNGEVRFTGASPSYSGQQISNLTPDELLEGFRSGLATSNARFRAGTITLAAVAQAYVCSTPIKNANGADGYSEQHHHACEDNGNADTPRYFCHNEGRKTDEDLEQHYGGLRTPSARSHAFSAASASLRRAAAD